MWKLQCWSAQWIWYMFFFSFQTPISLSLTLLNSLWSTSWISEGSDFFFPYLFSPSLSLSLSLCLHIRSKMVLWSHTELCWFFLWRVGLKIFQWRGRRFRSRRLATQQQGKWPSQRGEEGFLRKHRSSQYCVMPR